MLRLVGLFAFFTFCFVLGLTGCATVPASTTTAVDILDLSPSSENNLSDFSHAKPQAIPLGWVDLVLHAKKRKTIYSITDIEGTRALAAYADRSASLLQFRVSADPNLRRFLSFSWRVDQQLVDADVSDRDVEDSPARLVVAFDGDRSSLDLSDRLFFEQVKLLTGRDMPYATLMYVWDQNGAADSVILNPNTKRIRKIVLSNKNTPLKKWQHFRRDVYADYIKAYGKAPSGKIMSIAVMTDTDNTGGVATSYYGDIRLNVR